MIRPAAFTFNAETAVNNAFQQANAAEGAQEKALAEFDAFVEKLQQHGVDVTVVNDTPLPHTPDSIFPNNWISFHANNSIILYPMFAENRRKERKQTVLDAIHQKFVVAETIDFSGYELHGLFLEGTGSMVLDRAAKIAYACISPRTDRKVLDVFCTETKYTPCVFDAFDSQKMPIYHTNVVMCVAEKQVIICLESIPVHQRADVVHTIEQSGKQVVDITLQQMNQFAGNMLQVKGSGQKPLLVMSSTAYHALNSLQIQALEAHSQLLHSNLHTIETNGGGSARCMMAEVFLQPK